MSFVAYLIAQIPPLGVTCDFLGIFNCCRFVSPLSLYDKEMIAMTDKISLAVISTTVLAFAGLFTVKILINLKLFHGASSQFHWRSLREHSIRCTSDTFMERRYLTRGNITMTMTKDQLKAIVCETIVSHKGDIKKLADDIWAEPELATKKSKQQKWKLHFLH